MGGTGKRIFYLDGRSVSVYDLIAAKITWPLKSKGWIALQNRRMVDPPSKCIIAPDEISLGSDSILDHKVWVVKVKRAPNDAWQTTEWRMPDLGCDALQYRIEEKQPDGSFQLVTEGKAANLNLSEPDSQLFDDGSTYTELKPCEVEHRLRERMGLSTKDMAPCQGEGHD